MKKFTVQTNYGEVSLTTQNNGLSVNEITENLIVPVLRAYGFSYTAICNGFKDFVIDNENLGLFDDDSSSNRSSNTSFDSDPGPNPASRSCSCGRRLYDDGSCPNCDYCSCGEQLYDDGGCPNCDYCSCGEQLEDDGSCPNCDGGWIAEDDNNDTENYTDTHKVWSTEGWDTNSKNSGWDTNN